MLIVRLHPEEKQSLEKIAEEHGLIYGKKGSISQLLRAIAEQLIAVEIGDYNVPEGGENCCIRISPKEKETLDDSILGLGLTYRGKPSQSLLLKAIAHNQAKLKKIFSDPP